MLIGGNITCVDESAGLPPLEGAVVIILLACLGPKLLVPPLFLFLGEHPCSRLKEKRWACYRLSTSKGQKLVGPSSPTVAGAAGVSPLIIVKLVSLGLSASMFIGGYNGSILLTNLPSHQLT